MGIQSQARHKGQFRKVQGKDHCKGLLPVTRLDFNEIFAPVVRVDSVRVVFTIAAANDLYILHIDCKNAFLYGESDVDIYLYGPEMDTMRVEARRASGGGDS
jgi:hypothetical protein